MDLQALVVAQVCAVTMLLGKELMTWLRSDSSENTKALNANTSAIIKLTSESAHHAEAIREIPDLRRDVDRHETEIRHLKGKCPVMRGGGSHKEG